MNSPEIRIDATGSELLSVTDVKDYAGISGTGRDDQINMMIPAVRELQEQWTRCSFVPKALTAQWAKGDYADGLFLPFGPVISIDSVKRVHDDQTLSDALVEGTDWYKAGLDFPWIHFYKKWTSAGKVVTGMRIQYSVGWGYGSGEGPLPDPIKTAMLRHITTDILNLDEPDSWRPVLYDWVKAALAPYRRGEELAWF